MHRHMFALFATLALSSTTTTTATIATPLFSPLTLRPVNVTIPDRENWPAVPWVHPIDPSASIAIEHYGRYVCSDGDASCEARVVDSLKQVVHIIDNEYTMGRDKVDSFRAGPVVLWFRQEKAVPKVVVEDLAVVVGELMGTSGRMLLNYVDTAA